MRSSAKVVSGRMAGEARWGPGLGDEQRL